MKKTVSLILAVLLAVSLAACGEKTVEEPSAVNSQPDTGVSSELTPAGEGTDPATGAGSQTPETTYESAGYIDDPVDHYSRDTYDIVYLTDGFTFLHQNWLAAMQAVQDRLNCRVTNMSGNSDAERYLQNIEIVALDGVDGVIADCPSTTQARAFELFQEYDLNFIGYCQVFIDANQQLMAPQVVADQYLSAKKTIDWLIANYKSYLGDIDTSKLGLINIGFKGVPDFEPRGQAPEDVFTSTFPESAYFFCDAGTAGGITQDAAITLTSATVSSHPEIEYWWVTGCVEFFGVGAARALEELGKTDTSLCCVFGAGANVEDWKSLRPDQKTPNVACLMEPDLTYGAPAVAGIVALIDGRATPDTLWKERAKPDGWIYGDSYGVWVVEAEVVTRENYQEYLDSVNERFLGDAGH
jgi:ABC-type sugar transport system substrate-binding protein